MGIVYINIVYMGIVYINIVYMGIVYVLWLWTVDIHYKEITIQKNSCYYDTPVMGEKISLYPDYRYIQIINISSIN